MLTQNKSLTSPILAIINPKAGDGQSKKKGLKIIKDLQQLGLLIDYAITENEGEAGRIALNAYKNGSRHFISIGGDGTAYEIINGLYPYVLTCEKPTLSFIPTGTGNSFIREFIKDPKTYKAENFLNSKNYDCDVVKLIHSEGELFFINLMATGFACDVVNFRNCYLNNFGNIGYIIAVLLKLTTVKKFNMQSMSNSRYTGGTMLISPHAKIDDGFFDVNQGSNLSKLTLLKLFLQIYKGNHIESKQVSVSREKIMDLNFKNVIPVMIDGNIVHIKPQRLEILPKSLIVKV